MMHRTRTFALGTSVAIAIISAPLFAGGKQLSDPKEIFKRAGTAMKTVKTVSYTAKFTSDGWVKPFVSEVEGRAVLGPNGEYDVPRFYCEVSIKKADWDASQSFTAGCDGNEYYLIDAKTKKAHHDMDPTVLGANSRDIQRVSMREFTLDEPFKDELEAKEIALKGTKTIEGEMCYELEVKTEGGRQKAVVWWISAVDFLPRGVKRIYAPRGEGTEDGSTQLMLSNVVATTKTNNDVFKLTVPAGYAETDEFAP